jgi:hypothetical protein
MAQQEVLISAPFKQCSWLLVEASRSGLYSSLMHWVLAVEIIEYRK